MSNNSIKYISINKELLKISYIPKHFTTFNDIITNLNIIIQLQNTPKTIRKNIPNNQYYNYKNYYILNNTHLINKNESIYNYINKYKQVNISNNTILYLTVCEKQNGGGFSDIFFAIFGAGTLCGMIIKYVIWFAKFLYWFVKFVIWLFIDLLNPITLLNDFFNSIISIIIALCRLPYDIFMTLFNLSINTIGGWMQGFWGWDQSNLTENDKNSKYFKNQNLNNGKKCYLTSTNTVPFSVILGTILCPPMGVFMDMGLTGWLNILICILLTLIFYIPGLVYALLIIYS